MDQFLQVPGKQRVYAAGDAAHSAAPGGHGSVPLLAAAAAQEETARAENIARAIERQPSLALHYRDLGSVVSLGHGQGVAQVAGAIVQGFPGWLAWRLIHLARIAGFRNRLATALDWSIRFFYDWDTARLDMQPVPGPVKETAQTRPQSAICKGKWRSSPARRAASARRSRSSWARRARPLWSITIRKRTRRTRWWPASRKPAARRSRAAPMSPTRPT